MRVQIVLATTKVNPNTREAFAPSALDVLAHDLNRKNWGLTFDRRNVTVGYTRLGTAKARDGQVQVEAFLAPAFLPTEKIQRAIVDGEWAAIITARTLADERPALLATTPGEPATRVRIVTHARLEAITIVPRERAPHLPPVTPLGDK